MDTKILLCYTLGFLLCCTFIACISTASHTISPGQSLSWGQTITSPSGTFELGFFTPGNSQNYYIGIWQIVDNGTVLWVANRQQPVSEPELSVLELVENGNLTLSSPSKVAVWSTNSRSKVSNSSVAKLLDNGNFVITDAFDSSVIWQSFDHLSDTWLPGAELGYNNRTKRKLVLTSWRNLENPAPGPFSFVLDELPFNLSDYTNDYTYAFIRGTLEINCHLNFYVCYQDYEESILTEPSDQCEVNAISPGQSLSWPQTITSPSGTFELGFCSFYTDTCGPERDFYTADSSQNYYIGIWYKNLTMNTVVWVANREQPVYDLKLSVLELVEDGNLILSSPSKVAIWSTNSRSKVSNSSVAKLLNNGNFVITDAFDSSVIWQSFDHLSDTWLPGAELGYNNRTKRKLVLTSWINTYNPAPGPFFFVLDELPFNLSDYLDAFIRGTLEINGQLKFYAGYQGSGGWTLISHEPSNQCEVDASCGAFSICQQLSSPHCVCLEGFEPKVMENWRLEDFSDGCARKTPFHCSHGESYSFLAITDVGYGYPNKYETISNVSNDQCRLECIRKCSCTAFFYNSFDSGRCYMWIGDVYNIRGQSESSYSPDGPGLKIPLVYHASETKTKTTWIVLGVLAGFFSILSAATFIVFFRRRWSAAALATTDDSMVLYKHRDLRRATKNFSENLGEGAFGSVFKGMLPNSIAIAVKQLKCMDQGEKQFRAEVGTIGVIQHNNLIRMRGFCANASKRFLVYDYMPNGSLQSLLLGKNPTMLDWKARYHIAVGIARGLTYLHEECRDCIIHCDVKPENILLDSEYNPKLADFGLAKLLGRHHSRVLTTMRGTVGYLAPEWFSGEAITPKADVFSYGMVLIEVISGRRNREGLDDGVENFCPIQLASAVNKGEDVFTLLDCRLEGKADRDELSRACKVACWCIQEDEKDRPTMRQVIQILERVSDIGVPPVPQFLQRLIGGPSEGINYQETTSGSGSWSCSDVQSAFQAQISNCATKSHEDQMKNVRVLVL